MSGSDPGRGSRRGAMLLSLLLAWGAAACGSATVPEETEDIPTGPELVIGASLELSGPGAPIGLVEQRAVQVAIDKINEAGLRIGGARHKIRLVVRDNLGRPPDAQEAARAMIRDDQAIALIGGITVETSIAMASVAEAERVPLFAFAASDRVTQPADKRRYTFTVAPKSADVAHRIIEQIQSLDPNGPVSLFAGSDPHGDAGVPAVQKAARNGDVKIKETVRFANSGGDLAERAADVAAGRPKAIIVWATLPGAGDIATALREAGYEGDIIFDSGAGGEAAFPSRFHDAVEGAYMIHPRSLSGGEMAANSAADVERNDFYSRYTRRNGTFSGYAPYGADAVGLIAEALRRAGTVSGTSLRDALENNVIIGMAGSYRYTKNSHNGVEPDTLSVFQVRRGDWTRTG